MVGSEYQLIAVSAHPMASLLPPPQLARGTHTSTNMAFHKARPIAGPIIDTLHFLTLWGSLASLNAIEMYSRKCWLIVCCNGNVCFWPYLAWNDIMGSQLSNKTSKMKESEVSFIITVGIKPSLCPPGSDEISGPGYWMWPRSPHFITTLQHTDTTSSGEGHYHFYSILLRASNTSP